jgi:hypothetical protein
MQPEPIYLRLWIFVAIGASLIGYYLYTFGFKFDFGNNLKSALASLVTGIFYSIALIRKSQNPRTP